MSIGPEDIISRCIIYDRAFRGNIHLDELLFIFGQSAPDGASHESGVLRRLAPKDDDVHRIGCGIASNQNERKNKPPPGPRRRYYCGFRSARVGELTLSGDGYHVSLTLDNENGEAAHVDIALSVASLDRSERNTIKVDAGLALAEAFGPAVEHVCEGDRNDDAHPLHKDPECLRRGVPQTFALLPDGGTPNA